MINFTRLFIDLIRKNRNPNDEDIDKLCRMQLQAAELFAILKELLTVEPLQQQQQQLSMPSPMSSTTTESCKRKRADNDTANSTTCTKNVGEIDPAVSQSTLKAVKVAKTS